MALIKATRYLENKVDDNGKNVVDSNGDDVMVQFFTDDDGRRAASIISAGKGLNYIRRYVGETENVPTDAEVQSVRTMSFSRQVGDFHRDNGTKSRGKLFKAKTALAGLTTTVKSHASKKNGNAWTEEQALRILGLLNAEMEELENVLRSVTAKKSEEMYEM